jgi:hypothetical protein
MHRQKENIKIDCRETDCAEMDRITLPQDSLKLVSN